MSPDRHASPFSLDPTYSLALQLLVLEHNIAVARRDHAARELINALNTKRLEVEAAYASQALEN
jgi:hypothetical protein